MIPTREADTSIERNVIINQFHINCRRQSVLIWQHISYTVKMTAIYTAILSLLILTTVMTVVSVTAFKKMSHFKIQVVPTLPRSGQKSFNGQMRATTKLSVLENSPSSDSDLKGSSIFRKENIPIIGIAVGIIAFSFQLSVLYPWHIELHDSFSTLEVCVEMLPFRC